MPRTEAVTLGGRSYEIEQLPMRANREWRERLGAPVMQLVDLLQGLDRLELNAAGVQSIIGVVKDVLLGSMEICLEAVFAYSPALQADRERIEAEAYDDEAMMALGVVIKFAYPLDRVLVGLRGLNGIPTSTSLPLPNGGGGMMQPTAARRKRI